MTTLQRGFYGGAVETLGERRVGMTAATAGIKRDGNWVEPGGIDYTAFLKCPTILWQHDPMSPIAFCEALSLVNNELRAVIYFPEGCSALSEQAYSLIKNGVIRACSIGFTPTEMTPLDKSRPRGGQLITRCELTEISCVSVPADPDALITSRAIQGGMARFASLAKVSPVALQRALEMMPKRSDGLIMPHANHVFSILAQREKDEAASRAALPARQAAVEALRANGLRQRG
jgi:HK97 family phage prohead protease